MNWLDQIDHLEEYEKFLAAGGNSGTGATYQNLPVFEVAEEAPVLEKEPELLRVWEARVSGIRITPRSDVESDFRLEKLFSDPSFDPSESPFDVLEKMLPDDEKIKRLINYVADESRIQFAPELATRLHFLQEAVEEDPDEIPISPESLTNFIGFLQNTPNLKYPEVVLTPSNEISAQWRTASNRHFAVVFLPDGSTRYVIFTPNPKDPDKIDRLSGITSVDALMERAEPYGVFDWASL